MAYTINAVTIDGNTLVTNITVALDEKTEVVCNVPLVYPKTEADVLAAIDQRVKNEQIKFDAAPVLTAIKTALDLRVGKVQTAKVGVMVFNHRQLQRGGRV